MKKKILIGSIIAVALLTLVSFSSVVGYNSVKSDLDISVEENAIPIELEVQRVRELVQSIDLRKIIVNPEGVIETLEEVSSILEENEDCGCNGEVSDFEWFFPVICTLLLPAWTIAGIILLLSNGMIWQPVEIMAQIGLPLNCYWLGGSPWSK